MKARPYRSARRVAEAKRTREKIVAAAGALLAAQEGTRSLSLQAVAKKAGVTRLTVYNQFGSRRALLEALFDERAARGGLHRIPEAMADPDPIAGLRRVISIFCDFWSFDTAGLSRLHAAGASDRELEASLRERNERRRRLLSVLVSRMAEVRQPRDLVDVLFALTSLPFFAQLTSNGRTTEAACRLIEALSIDAVRRPLPARRPLQRSAKPA
jgi:AcrR family transcriptional regulator